MIVQPIVELGHNLGLSVIAEGVEDQASWDHLRGLSCDIAQGYYIAKPLPPESLLRWLHEQRPQRGDSRPPPASLVAV